MPSTQIGLAMPVIKTRKRTATVCDFARSLSSKLRGNIKLWTYQLRPFPLFWLHAYLVVGILGKRGEAFISTRSKARMISTDYMQICHPHKSTAVHSLTFLFVTSKHFSVPLFSLLFGPEDKGPPSSLFTCFPHHQIPQQFECMYLHPVWPCSQ